MIRTIQTVTGLLLAALVFASCQTPVTNPDEPGTGQMKGFVFTGQGAPVENASVTTDPTTRTVRTDKDGKFLIPIVTEGDYRITATHAVFGTGGVSAEVKARKNTLVDIVLGRAGGGNNDSTGNGGLLVHLKLDGNALDAQGTLLPGEIDGATPTTDRFGNPGKAMKFDGQDDAIRFSSTQRAELAGLPITWSFWMQPQRTAQGILDMQAPLGLYLHPVGDGIVFMWENGKFASIYTSTGFRNYVRLNKELSADGRWHHVVMRVTSEGMEVFYDGNAAGRAQWSGKPTTALSQQPLHLGIVRSINRTDPLRPFAGAIDDVMIYNRPLTNDEIARLYRRR